MPSDIVKTKNAVIGGQTRYTEMVSSPSGAVSLTCPGPRPPTCQLCGIPPDNVDPSMRLIIDGTSLCPLVVFDHPFDPLGYLLPRGYSSGQHCGWEATFNFGGYIQGTRFSHLHLRVQLDYQDGAQLIVLYAYAWPLEITSFASFGHIQRNVQPPAPIVWPEVCNGSQMIIANEITPGFCGQSGFVQGGRFLIQAVQ